MQWDELIDYWARRFGKRELLSREEVAEFLGMHPCSVDRRIAKGILKPTLISSPGQRAIYRFHKGEVLRLFVMLED